MAGQSEGFRVGAWLPGPGSRVTMGSVADVTRGRLTRAKGRLGAPRVDVCQAVAERQARIRIGGLTRFDARPRSHWSPPRAARRGLDSPGDCWSSWVTTPVRVGSAVESRSVGAAGRRQAFPDGRTTESQPLERLLTQKTVFDMRQDPGDVIGTRAPGRGNSAAHRSWGKHACVMLQVDSPARPGERTCGIHTWIRVTKSNLTRFRAAFLRVQLPREPVDRASNPERGAVSAPSSSIGHTTMPATGCDPATPGSHAFFENNASARRFISSGDTSSLWVATCQ